VAYLHLDERRAGLATGRVDQALIGRRKADYARYAKLTPLQVIMSDGEVPVGEYAGGNAPAGVLVGLPVSSGALEGRAHYRQRRGGAL
jgi:pyruvate,water dikinase